MPITDYFARPESNKGLELNEFLPDLITNIAYDIAVCLKNPCADDIFDVIQDQYKPEIVLEVKSKSNWKEWLVIELHGRVIEAVSRPELLGQHVWNIVHEQLWQEVLDTFGLKLFIERLCEDNGWMGEPGDDDDRLESDNAERARDCRDVFEG